MPPILMQLPAHTNPERDRLATVYDLQHLAVFDVSGADAISFLQGQITNDIAGTGKDLACLAGYCTPQGRLLATMILHHAEPAPDGLPILRGLIRRDILVPVLKRLSMFVMRAKAKLSEVQFVVRGVSLAGKREEFESALGVVLPSAVWNKKETVFGTWIAAPSDTTPRWWLISGPEHSDSLSLLAKHCVTGSTQDWLALDIAAGLPWIEATTQDLFIPQTLNLDLIQGVSFTKGCYPGQEIVARSHYRGTVKRRMVRARIALDASGQPADGQPDQNETQLIPGADVYDGSREDQVCGRIINIARLNDVMHVLLESSFEAADHQQLRALSAHGPALTLADMPYPVRPEQG